MPSPVDPLPNFAYPLPVPSVSRKIALTVATIFFCGFAYLPAKIGLPRTLESLSNDPFIWLLLAGIILGPGAFFLVLAFLPKSWRPRVEFSRGAIRYFPIPVLRWMGEPSSEIPVKSDVREIIICQGSRDSARYGFRIMARAEGGGMLTKPYCWAMELRLQQGFQFN
jgi:hypothetical protein